MFISNKIYHFARIFSSYFIWFLFAMMSLSGCNQSTNNIPSASTLISGKATLSWDEVPGAISYNVYGSTSPGVTKLSGSKFRNVRNPFTITHLQPNKTYYFVVTVVADSGESKESKEISYTAIANTEGSIQFGNIVDHSKPDALNSELVLKSTVKDSPHKTQDVTLSWDDVPNAISYNIYWSDKPGVNKNNGIKISNVKNPHKMTWLIKGEKYYFVVTAVNASGESKESKELSITVGQ
jgi:fibronectin type 3 domain-containing protein